MNLLSINDMVKVHTDRKIFDHAEFSVAEGDKIGIVGVNGTGKSTLLKILAGLDQVDEGIYTKGKQVYIKFLSQDPEFPSGITIYDYVIKANKEIEHMWDLEGEAKSMLNKLGFESHLILVDHLSGGEKKRVALAAALLTTCDLLILDEPTNHLDSEMADWLELYLKNRRGALVMVTHDRYFLDQVCNRIVEIDHGNLYNYDGNYEMYLELKAQREEQELATERKNKSLFRIELEWMKRGARARSTKQKARIERFDELKNRKKVNAEESVSMSSIGSRLGKKTVEVQGISKSYDGRILFEDFEYIFLRNDRIGIIGYNGCGKSTFLNIITGNEVPDKGKIEIGETVKIAYFSQHNEYMDENMKAIEYVKEVGEYIETTEGKITASKMLERFLFTSTMQYQFISKLSGGEKRRLYLLRILMESPNVLILDEPTNDLDIATLNVLEDFLDEFQGIVITVSHDRYFLDRTVERIFAFEEGKIVQYEGNFTDYQIQARERGVYGRNSREKQQELKGSAASNKQEKTKIKKLKFTYAEEKEFATIDDEIAKTEHMIEELENNMCNYATDFLKLREMTEKKEQLEQQLELKMERWMYLQELAEKIKDSGK